MLKRQNSSIHNAFLSALILIYNHLYSGCYSTMPLLLPDLKLNISTMTIGSHSHLLLGSLKVILQLSQKFIPVQFLCHCFHPYFSWQMFNQGRRWPTINDFKRSQHSRNMEISIKPIFCPVIFSRVLAILKKNIANISLNIGSILQSVHWSQDDMRCLFSSKFPASWRVLAKS